MNFAIIAVAVMVVSTRLNGELPNGLSKICHL